MKYGRLRFPAAIGATGYCNLGDIAQVLAVDIIYCDMKIDEKDIVNIFVDELGTYRGEKLLLPIAGYFNYRKKAPAFPTSEDIIPVFLSLYTISSAYLNKKEFWKKQGVIGCRDENTMKLMRKRGYDSWLMGCMTMLFPRRDNKPEKEHVFIVDAEPAVYDYIPERLMNLAEYVTHLVKVDHTMTKEQIGRAMEEKTKKLLQRYRDEATLVITSRLHCAAPCIAMGIPTIVVRKGFDERYGWIDKFIHLYTADEFEKIDWNPDPIELEEHKKHLLKAAVSIVNREVNRDAVREIHDFYMNRDRKKLRATFMVRSYVWLRQYAPGLTWFIRKMLKPFTITGKSGATIAKADKKRK